jgi:hypothetical protein
MGFSRTRMTEGLVGGGGGEVGGCGRVGSEGKSCRLDGFEDGESGSQSADRFGPSVEIREPCLFRKYQGRLFFSLHFNTTWQKEKKLRKKGNWCLGIYAREDMYKKNSPFAPFSTLASRLFPAILAQLASCPTPAQLRTAKIPHNSHLVQRH